MHDTHDFLQEMRRVGLAPLKALCLMDGKITRFRVEGDKPGSRNGWAVFHSYPSPWGVFGSWKTGDQHTWHATSNESMTPADRQAMRLKLAAAQAQRAEEDTRVKAAAAARALKLWSGAKPATDDHPYLVAKGVHAFGLRALRNQLLVPARDASGKLHTLQFIGPEGEKQFLKGGRVSGCYCAIGRVRDALLLAEGYATGATLHQATGHAVAVAFNRGNLLSVARALRAKFPRLNMLICADNDASTPGNPGLTAAKEAARVTGAGVVWPQFEGVVHG